MNILDRFIAYFAPEAGTRRMAARATLQQIAQLTGAATGPYQAAKINRLNSQRRIVSKENEVSGATIDSLRADSWQLYRNNPSARKIVRSITAKVVGKRGMNPESLAMNEDGSPAEMKAATKDRVEQEIRIIQKEFVDSLGDLI